MAWANYSSVDNLDFLGVGCYKIKTLSSRHDNKAKVFAWKPEDHEPKGSK